MNAIVDRARALAPEIIAAAAEMDALRKLPDHLAVRFREAGLYRLCIPKAYDGLEASPRVTIETLEMLAEADASAAWCIMISATTGAFGAYLDDDLGRSIFADPALVFTGVYAPMGKAVVEGDGYRVTGRWKWNSGGQNATWLCGGCIIYDNGAPRMLTDKIPDHRMMLFPASDVQFIDTWHTSGLRGSGSGDMAVENLLIPAARSVSLITDKPRVATPLYNFPVFGLLALGIAAVASGNASAALREFAAEASGKRLPGGRLLTDRGTVQATFAEATASLRAARAYFLAEVEASWAEAQSAPAISLTQRAHLRLAATHLVRTAAEVVRTVQDLAGGSGVFLASSLHRRLADAQTMTAHMMVAPATYELTGRALLGVAVSTAEL
jgi:alkylation response protein AidB-like acyl-CoA dehydrogenase